MTNLQRHDIALGWHRVRRAALEAGRAKILEQAALFGPSDYWTEQVAEWDRKLANLDDSTDVLMQSGGYGETAGAIDNGNVVSGTVIDDDPIHWVDNGDGTETATVILSGTFYDEDPLGQDSSL